MTVKDMLIKVTPFLLVFRTPIIRWKVFWKDKNFLFHF
jgi:hypothetical protein